MGKMRVFVVELHRRHHKCESSPKQQRKSDRAKRQGIESATSVTMPRRRFHDCRNPRFALTGLVPGWRNVNVHIPSTIPQILSRSDTQKVYPGAIEPRRMQALYPERDIRLLDGPAICKAENVWTGFRGARGDVLMILNGDLTVIPEELPLLFQAIANNVGEFINGSRLVYPAPKTAMKFSKSGRQLRLRNRLLLSPEAALQRRVVRHQGSLGKKTGRGSSLDSEDGESAISGAITN
jgi:hypothetical protein